MTSSYNKLYSVRLEPKYLKAKYNLIVVWSKKTKEHKQHSKTLSKVIYALGRSTLVLIKIKGTVNFNKNITLWKLTLWNLHVYWLATGKLINIHLCSAEYQNIPNYLVSYNNVELRKIQTQLFFNKDLVINQICHLMFIWLKIHSGQLKCTLSLEKIIYF
jgi:hypothetical protein